MTTDDVSGCRNFYFKTIPARRCLISKKKIPRDNNLYVLILRSLDHPRLNFPLLADHFSFKEIGRNERIVSDKCEIYY